MKVRRKLNKIKQNINSKTAKLRKVINKIKQKVSKVQKVAKLPNKRSIPAANTKNMNKDFKILYQDGNTVKVTGRDLVYSIPTDIVTSNDSQVITIIPANPCYWTGTRISALAQGYQNYRPVDMQFNYIPQCAVTQQGNVLAGTLWNQAPANDNLQQSLRTSNGGQLSQCYKSFTSTVRLKSNLQFNLYKTAGQFDQESNPFLFIALAIGCKNQNNARIIPGYFYVTWSFILKNPIGNTNIFYNSGATTYQSVLDDSAYENKTIVFLSETDDELQCGTIMQIEDDEEDQLTAYYNGSAYAMEPTDLVWYFANSSIQQTNTLTREVKGELQYEWDVLAGQQDAIGTAFFFFIDEQTQEVNIIALDMQYEYPVTDFPRTLRLYAWDDFPAEYLPLPEITMGEMYARSLAPGSTTVHQTLYKIPLRNVNITQYTRDQQQKAPPRNKKLRRKCLPKPSAVTKSLFKRQESKQPKVEEEKPIPVRIERLSENKIRCKSASGKRYCNTIIEEQES